ncbi:MAG: SAM-dependent methyltransferase [Gammaproteobacteria bacterium]
MITPFSPIQDQINQYFPPATHPYRLLERVVEERLTPTSAVLDIGCGREAPVLAAMRGKAGRLCGIDLVEFTYSGDDIELYPNDVGNIESLADNSIDLAYSRSVMEHVPDAQAAFSEIGRVLKPSAQYVFLTPNKYDYVSIIANIVPNKYHGRIVKVVEGREEEDVFPTEYQCNTFKDINSLANTHGFHVKRLERLVQYPGYFSFNRSLFWLGSQYERLLRSSELFSPLRGWIFCIIEKKA